MTIREILAAVVTGICIFLLTIGLAAALVLLMGATDERVFAPEPVFAPEGTASNCAPLLTEEGVFILDVSNVRFDTGTRTFYVTVCALFADGFEGAE